MNQSDKKRFAQIMYGMADNFRDSITKIGMAMRFDMLKNFTIDQVEQAAKSIMARRKYTKMPPIAEFIVELKPKELDIEDRALVVANQILDHLHRHGAEIYPEFDDIIANTLMRTRWPYFRWASELVASEEKWWVKEFCAAYRAHSNIEHIAIEVPEKLKKLAHGIGNGLPQ